MCLYLYKHVSYCVHSKVFCDSEWVLVLNSNSEQRMYTDNHSKTEVQKFAIYPHLLSSAHLFLFPLDYTSRWTNEQQI
jgi:hypothetical protein